jgi:hypothetical protein
MRATGTGAYSGLVVDKIFSLGKSKAGATGATGANALSVSASPTAVSVPCTSNGTPKASIPGFQITAYVGTTDVTTTATYGYSISGLSGVTNLGSGAFTVAGMTADTGYVEVTVTSGGTSQVIRVAYAKAKDGAPYVYQDASISTPPSNSYSVCGTISLLMGGGGNFTVDANGSFLKSGSGSINVDGFIEYSLNGGSSWTTLGSFTGNPAINPDPGDFSYSGGGTGASISLSSKQTVMWRIQIEKSSTNSFSSFGGTFAVGWSG